MPARSGRGGGRRTGTGRAACGRCGQTSGTPLPPASWEEQHMAGRFQSDTLCRAVDAVTAVGPLSTCKLRAEHSRAGRVLTAMPAFGQVGSTGLLGPPVLPTCGPVHSVQTTLNKLYTTTAAAGWAHSGGVHNGRQLLKMVSEHLTDRGWEAVGCLQPYPLSAACACEACKHQLRKSRPLPQRARLREPSPRASWCGPRLAL